MDHLYVEDLVRAVGALGADVRVASDRVAAASVFGAVYSASRAASTASTHDRSVEVALGAVREFQKATDVRELARE